jgi:hypothetical protein
VCIRLVGFFVVVHDIPREIDARNNIWFAVLCIIIRCTCIIIRCTIFTFVTRYAAVASVLTLLLTLLIAAIAAVAAFAAVAAIDVAVRLRMS